MKTNEFGQNVKYHALGEGEAFRVAITYQDYLVGGYETEVGKEFFGSVFGQNEQEDMLE